MKLQTQIPLSSQPHNQIDYSSKLVLFGSCFSENIGDKLTYFKFQSLVNPVGILFHPLAIETLISKAINKNYYTEDELIFQNEQWSCLDAHSKLNDTSKTQLLQRLNTALDQSYNALSESSHVIITLGTAWVYRFLETDKLVANCHKLPQKKFLKELLSLDEINESLNAIVALVRSINPKVSFIFTVSPVRHIKDGFVENTQSKAHLIAAIHQVVDARKQLYYFPSYELMMDELRDYRFYNDDMLHPSSKAINYIWEKFQKVWMTETTINTSKRIGQIQAKKAHRPFNPNSEAHQTFLEKLDFEIKELQSEFPQIQFH